MINIFDEYFEGDEYKILKTFTNYVGVWKVHVIRYSEISIGIFVEGPKQPLRWALVMRNNRGYLNTYIEDANDPPHYLVKLLDQADRFQQECLELSDEDRMKL